MGLIPQVKCGRCDRTYSGLRSRCPYCGARRHKKGKRTTDGDNSTWKLIIGVLLIVVLIAAVVVILVTSSNEKKPNDSGGEKEPVNNSDDGSVGSGKNDGENDGENNNDPNDGNNGENNNDPNGENNGGTTVDPNGGTPGGTTDDPTTPGGTGTTPPPSTVIASSITVNTQYGATATDHSIAIGESFQCTATITPSNATSIPTWSSDNASVSVIPADETGLKVTITGMSKGVANITATVDSLTYTFVVRCTG